MTKRCQKILKTKEAETLRQVRLLRNLSIRKTAEKLGKSHTLVNHIELGRAEISKAYIENFLSCLQVTQEEWDSLMKKDKKNKEIKHNFLADDCIRKIKCLSSEKLERLQTYISML